MRDLIVLGVEQGVTDRDMLANLAIRRGIFVREEGTRPYDYSSIYRYLDSIRFLRFEQAETISDPIVWSTAAKELVDAAKNSSPDHLSPQEKAIFRTRILESEANEQFLSCFCMVGKRLRSESDFARRCKPLYILRLLKKPKDDKRSLKSQPIQTVEFTQDRDSAIRCRKPAMEFLYTYRLWCLDSGLIEELNVKEAERSGVPKNLKHVLYPIRYQPPPSTVEFLQLLYAFANEPAKPVVIPIPKLLYGICLDLRIPVHVFLDLLVQTWKSHRDLLHLERGPGILVSRAVASQKRAQSDRFGNHRFYIIIDGTLRSNLILYPRKKQNE